VTKRVQTAIVADEAVWTLRDLREIIGRHPADAVNIKLAKTGGLREALELVVLARVSETKIIVGCMAESCGDCGRWRLGLRRRRRRFRECGS
jgi:L-alanine-DL-glutamate epimerase-like enolase superfamily enzyme